MKEFSIPVKITLDCYLSVKANNQDDTYEFITWFYNGGTDLREMLQKGFDQREKGNDNDL